MKWRAKADPKAGKVAFEVLAGRQEGRGIFAIEDAAEEVTRRTKLALIAERLASYDRGYPGTRLKARQQVPVPAQKITSCPQTLASALCTSMAVPDGFPH